MKKKFLLFLIFCFIWSSTPALAATTTPKYRLQEIHVRNIRNFFGIMTRRIEAAILRLENISSRIDSRIAKMKARGVDTSKAERDLATAKTKITEAKAALSDAKTKFEAALISKTPRDTFANVREILVKGVVGKIKEAHQALVQAVRDIKNAEGNSI